MKTSADNTGRSQRENALRVLGAILSEIGDAFMDGISLDVDMKLRDENLDEYTLELYTPNFNEQLK